MSEKQSRVEFSERNPPAHAVFAETKLTSVDFMNQIYSYKPVKATSESHSPFVMHPERLSHTANLTGI